MRWLAGLEGHGRAFDGIAGAWSLQNSVSLRFVYGEARTRSKKRTPLTEGWGWVDNRK